MQASSISPESPEETYIPRDDASEAARVDPNGLGDVLFIDDTDMAEFGIEFDRSGQ